VDWQHAHDPSFALRARFKNPTTIVILTLARCGDLVAVGVGIVLPYNRCALGTWGRKGRQRRGFMAELISEPITPHAGTFDTKRMGRGEPGLPNGFTWRGESVDVVEELGGWKQSSREGGGAGDLYLRRHYYKLRMSDGSIWTVYFVRQSPRTGDPKIRWFLYAVDTE